MAQMPLVAIPAPQSVGGRPRRQGLYDTELYKGSTAIPVEIQLFNNFAQFRVAPEDTNIVQSKVQGRDTNLQGGGQAGLPHGHAFYWYQWRFKVLTYGINLTTAGNAAITDEIRRIRELTSVTFKFQNADLIVVPTHELPSGPGPNGAVSNHSASVNWGLGWGVPHRNNAYDVTMSGKPVGIDPMAQFRCLVRCETGAGLTPDIDYFLQTHLVGISAIGIA